MGGGSTTRTGMVWERFIVGSRRPVRVVRGVGLGVGLVLVLVGPACAGGGTSPLSPVPYTGGTQPSGEGGDDDDDATDGGPSDAGPGGADEGADEGLDDGVDGTECCMRHALPGCSEPAAAQCVCDQLPQCCAEEWTQECVEEGVLLGCLQCGADEGGEPDEGGDTGVGMNLGSCCLPGDGPGCAEEQLASCVCDEDPFCCDSLWDDVCAGMVEDLGCGDCPGGDDGDGDGGMPADDGGTPADDGGMPADDGGGMPTGGPCCTVHSDPLCGNLLIEACVCLDDPFCCLFSWDATCVSEVESLMCGTC